MSPGKRHHEGIVTGTILGRDGGRSWTGIDEQLEDAQRSTPPDGLMEQNLSVQLGIFGQESTKPRATRGRRSCDAITSKSDLSSAAASHTPRPISPVRWMAFISTP